VTAAATALLAPLFAPARRPATASKVRAAR
jgi:hypothetical protein